MQCPYHDYNFVVVKHINLLAMNNLNPFACTPGMLAMHAHANLVKSRIQQKEPISRQIFCVE